MTVCFVDTETTGLDPDRHEIWEVGLIADIGGDKVGWMEHVWYLPVDLGRADSVALKIGGFHDRHPFGDQNHDRDIYVTELDEFATEFAALTRGTHLVGAVISFDEERLRKLLRANGCCPEWHYHLVDVEALAAGSIAAMPPWNSTNLSSAVGVDPGQFDRHTALGDARWAKAIYDKVMFG